MQGGGVEGREREKDAINVFRSLDGGLCFWLVRDPDIHIPHHHNALGTGHRTMTTHTSNPCFRRRQQTQAPSTAPMPANTAIAMYTVLELPD